MAEDHLEAFDIAKLGIRSFHKKLGDGQAAPSRVDRSTKSALRIGPFDTQDARKLWSVGATRRAVPHGLRTLVMRHLKRAR